MKKLSVLIVFVLATLTCRFQPTLAPGPEPLIPNQNALPPGDSTRVLEVEGRKRSYILHVPISYQSAKPVPVVLVFHGGGGNAQNAIWMTGFSELADTAGFLAVYPNGTGKLKNRLLTWNGGSCCGYAQENNVDDVAFVRAILDDLREIAPVDDKRIFATGMSNGGIISYRLACELSEQIAAIGPVSGTLNLAGCAPEQPVAVIHFHGTDDQHLPYDGGVGPKSVTGVNYTSVPDSIHFWVTYDQCEPDPATESFEGVVHTVYDSCREGTAVELYTIIGGGHAWPGDQPGSSNGDLPTQNISATQTIWDFFIAHPRP